MKHSTIDEPKAADVLHLASIVAEVDLQARKGGEISVLRSLFEWLESNPKATCVDIEGCNWELVPFRPTSRLSDILALEGLPFVANAYRALLGRNPDFNGLTHYVVESKKSAMPKIRLVQRLRDSEEGRNYNHSFSDADKGFWLFGCFRRRRKWGGSEFESCLIRGSEPVFPRVETDETCGLAVTRAIEHFCDFIERRHDTLELELEATGKQIGSLMSRIQALSEEVRSKTDQTELMEIVDRSSGRVAMEFREEIAKARSTVDGSLAQVASGLREEIANVKETIAAHLQESASKKLRTEENDRQLIQLAGDFTSNKRDLNDVRSQLNLLSERLDASVYLTKALHEKVYPGQLEEYYQVDAPPLFAIAKSKSDFEIGGVGSPERDDAIYLSFENAFYSAEHVRRKQSFYLPHLKHARTSASPFLDLGCGRGEFLQILRDNDIVAKGVEVNRLEAEMLQKEGFAVHNQDLFEFLETNTDTWSGMSLIHVIEHLDTVKVIDMFDRLSASVERDGALIIETINPHCPLAFASFYMDHTHVKPYAPEVIAYHMQRVGFVDVKILYTNLISTALWSSMRERNYHDFGVVGIKP